MNSYINLSPPRLGAICVLVGFGAALTYWFKAIWPFIYPSTQWAFLAMGLAFASLVALSGACGWVKRVLIAITVLMTVAWACAGLLEIIRLANYVLGVFVDGRRAGATPVASLQAAIAVIRNITPVQSKAFLTCIFVGLPPLVLLLLTIVLTLKRTSENRVSENGPWKARWMSEAQIGYLRSVHTGLPLGLNEGALLRYAPNSQKGWRAGHHVVIAGTRAGKGVSVVIPAIVDHHGPVVALDVKGENFAVTRRWRRSLGRRVVVLNPFGIIEESRDGYNPLDYIRPDHLVRDIDVIAEGLVRPEPGAGSHFSSLATQIIAATIEVVFTKYNSDDRNLNAVADILFAADFEKQLEVWANNATEYGRRPAQAAAMLLGAGENERGGVRTTLKKAFEWARSDEMRSFLQRSSASFDDLLDDKIDIFVVVPLDQLDAQSIFMRLMINIVLGTVVRQDGYRTVSKSILLILDEFVRLGRMEKLLNIANVAAGAGIEALFVTQDKGQIETAYGRGDTDSLLGSCVTARIFGLGRAESNTAEWAANALGDQTVLTQSRQEPIKIGEKPRVSTTEHKQKPMTSDQLLELPADEMLCLIGSQLPLRLKSIVSHNHKAYKFKLDPNPTRSVTNSSTVKHR